MSLMKTKIVIMMLFLFFSCDYKRNNPIIDSDVNYSSIITNSAVRDFVIIENFTANDFHYNAINHSCTQGYDLNNDGNYTGISGPQDCYGFWCEWDGSSCNDVDRDVVAVANDEAGLYIYEIIDGVFNPNEIYFRDLIEFAGDGELDIELRSVYYAENHNTLYMLDKFEYIYNLYLPPVISEYNNFPLEHDCTLPSEETLEYLQCGQFNHATKFVVDEGNPNTPHQLPFEMFVLYKENLNTDSSILESFSEIRRYWYNNNPNGDQNSSPVCDNAINFDYGCDDNSPLIGHYCYDPHSNEVYNINEPSECLLNNLIWRPLNYNITDLFYSSHSGQNRLFISNPSKEFYSVSLYYYDPFGGEAAFKNDLLTPQKVNTIYAYQDYLISGMKDMGCYITLLNEHGISGNLFDKLHIAENFSVYDIHYDEHNNKLLLSCGSNGVLVYNWDGESLSVSLDKHILSSYAHTAKFHDGMIIVGTENGIEIY